MSKGKFFLHLVLFVLGDLWPFIIISCETNRCGMWANDSYRDKHHMTHTQEKASFSFGQSRAQIHSSKRSSDKESDLLRT